MVCLAIAFVLGLTLESYLLLVQNQSKSVSRSQSWNQSMIVTEAGVEDAFSLINKLVGKSTNIRGWTNTISDDGWTSSGNVYSLTRYLDASKSTYYKVFVTNAGYYPVISSQGYVPGPTWVAASAPLSRRVVVQTSIDSLFNVCMASLGSIDLKGNGIATDSFDSADPNYSTNGFYTTLRRKAGGDVVTNNTFTNSVLNVGNAQYRRPCDHWPGRQHHYRSKRDRRRYSLGDSSLELSR